MKVSVVTAPGETQVVDAPRPQVGAADVLVKIRACGICATDLFFVSIGGVPGDHVVINPMAAPSGIIGNGGTSGALSEYLLIEDAVRGTSFEVVPDHIPFE